MIKKTAKFNFFLLTSLVFFASIVVIFGTKIIKPKNYEWNLKKLSSGSYELYIGGPDVQKVTVADIKFFTGQDSLPIIVKPGGFYTNEMINNINSDGFSYLVIKAPGENVTIDTSKPLLQISTDSSSNLQILPVSQIYVSKKGVYFPEVK